MIKQPVWSSTLTTSHTYPQLKGNYETDIVIIGAGITGLTAAMRLLEQGKKTTIIDAFTVGSGTTGSSTANLYVPVEAYYHQIETKFNKKVAAQVALSRKQAINYIEQLVAKYTIACSFQRRPWYMFTRLSSYKRKIEQEYAALSRCGMSVEYVDELPLDLSFVKAIKLDNQARFNPLHYLYALADILVNHGCQLYEHTPALSYKEHNDYCEVVTANGQLKARKLIIATHIPIGVNFLQMKVFPYRSYAVAARLGSSYPNGVFWDIAAPHFSISSHGVKDTELDLLVIAGNSHKTGQAATGSHKSYYKRVTTYLKTYFDIASIDYAWSAQHYQPADGLPYIGHASRLSKHSFAATGYSADGLTYGTVAGMLLADSVLGRTNKLSEVYKATRITLMASAPKFIKENANVLGQYLEDYPGNVEAKDYLAIKAGQGKVIQENGEKWAIARDANNQLHRVSAVCTHMKCIVKWNDMEKTWDCPCHGSRFTIHGTVIEGPALSPLPKKPFNKGKEQP